MSLPTIPTQKLRLEARRQFRRVYDPTYNETYNVNAPYFVKLRVSPFSTVTYVGTSPSTGGNLAAVSPLFAGGALRLGTVGTWTGNGIFNLDVDRSGVLHLAATAAAGAARQAVLYGSDQLSLNMDTAGAIEWVIEPHTLPSAVDAQLLFGVSGALATVTTDTFTADVSGFKGALFRLKTTGAVDLFTDDNSTATTHASATTLAAAEHAVLRVEWTPTSSTSTKVRFFKNGVELAPNTNFAVTTTSNAMRVQPYASLEQVNTTATAVGYFLKSMAAWSN